MVYVAVMQKGANNMVAINSAEVTFKYAGRVIGSGKLYLIPRIGESICLDGGDGQVLCKVKDIIHLIQNGEHEASITIVLENIIQEGA